VPGVYAAGDNCSPMHQLAHAIGTGNRVGAELSRRLILSRTLPTHPYPLPRMLTDDALLTLRRHAVRLTALRQSILGALLQSPFALSRTESEPHLTLDRVTVYRTLRTFEEKGIVHRIIDHSETVRYAAACPDAPALANDHVHFKCTACQHIYCLSQVPVPAVTLPGTYQVLRSDHLLSGICGQCHLPEASDGYLLPMAVPVEEDIAE